jgi:hypothetical protein
MAATQLTKIVSVFLDGQRLPVKEASYTPSKFKREAVPGLAPGEILGIVDGEPEPAQLEVTLAHSDGLSIQAYKEVQGATITMVTSGGKTYTMGDAYYVDHAELSGGEWKVTFQALRDAEQGG